MGKTFILSSPHFWTSFPSPNFLCCQLLPLFPLKHHHETWGDSSCILCFVVSPAPVLTAWKGWMRQSSSIGKPLVALQGLLSSLAKPHITSIQVTCRHSWGSLRVLQWSWLAAQQACCDSDTLCHLSSICKTTPKQLLQKTVAFFFCSFCETEQILPLYKEKRLFGCQRGV